MNLLKIQKKILKETELIPGCRSFLFKPARPLRAPVLLLHGFSASPWEVKELGAHLKKRGHLVYGPRLAGHGVGRPEFDSKGLADWMADAEEAFSCLNRPGKKISVIGHSMGGALATLLAAAHPLEIQALILGAPAFRLKDPTAPLTLIPLVRFFKPTMNFKPFHIDSKHWTLNYSSSRIAELLRCGRLAAKAAPQLSLPVLMLQARVDKLVSRRKNEAVFKKIPSRHKKLVIYDTTEHNVFHRYNPLQKKVFSIVDTFLEATNL